MCEVLEKGKTRVPDEFCPLPLAPRMKENVPFALAVWLMPRRIRVSHQIVHFCKDLEGKLARMGRKVSSFGTAVYLEFKCITDICSSTHTAARCPTNNCVGGREM